MGHEDRLQSCRDSLDEKEINFDFTKEQEEEMEYWYWRMSVDPAEDEWLDFV